MSSPSQQEQAAKSTTLFDHLLELRSRLLNAVLGVIVVFCSLVYFAQDIYQYLAKPLLATMPAGAQMIATDVASPFFAPFKLTIVLSIFRLTNMVSLTKITTRRMQLIHNISAFYALCNKSVAKLFT
jgi:Sec-independent protein secretion pathway component TatC